MITLNNFYPAMPYGYNWASAYGLLPYPHSYYGSAQVPSTPATVGGSGQSGPIDPNTGIAPGMLNSGVMVNASQLQGVIPPTALNCADVATCVGAMAPGSIPAETIGAGMLADTVQINPASIPAVDPATGIADGALNPNVTVDASQINGTVAAGPIDPATGIAAGELAADVTVPVSNLQPVGPAGTAPISDGTTVSWQVPSAGGAITAADVAAAMAAEGNGELATVYGADAAGNPVNGVVYSVGDTEKGEGDTTAFTLASGGSQTIASVTALEEGMYAIEVRAAASVATVNGGTGAAIGAAAENWASIVTVETDQQTGLDAFYYHSGRRKVVDVVPGETYPANYAMDNLIDFSSLGGRRLVAGEKLDLKIYNSSNSSAGMGDLNYTPLEAPRIILHRLSDTDLRAA